VLDLYAEPGAATRPVVALSADIGLGKTRAWRERAAAVFLAAGRSPVLAVPRHRLGAEVVRDLTGAGISAQVYRGREAIDPEQPDEKMCRDFGRINLITEALGSVSARACQRRDKQCQFFDACGYQRQRLQRPDLWIVAHQCLFRAKPSFIPVRTCSRSMKPSGAHLCMGSIVRSGSGCAG
jgi:hypothetical protein